MLASKTYRHFKELIHAQRRFREVKHQAAQDREAHHAKLKKEVARATIAQEAVREWQLWLSQRVDYAIELWKAQDEVTNLTASLEASAIKLVADMDNLTATTERNGKLEQEVEGQSQAGSLSEAG